MIMSRKNRSPKRIWTHLIIAATLAALTTTAAAVPDVPAGIDHDPLDTLLQKYVDKQGLVDYAGWKASDADTRALQSYLKQFASSTAAPADDDEKIAALINAYNAFTIQFILDNYPTESIRLLDNPFDGQRHVIGGQKISVDDIEHKMLRPMIGWKVHSVVVCAARSCPPLLNRAYRADTWEQQMEERYRTWLARPDLNGFDTSRFRRSIEISRIFSWYSDDFSADHSVTEILRRYAPAGDQPFLAGDFRISYQPYHWGLNDQSGLGKDYSHSILRSLF